MQKVIRINVERIVKTKTHTQKNVFCRHFIALVSGMKAVAGKLCRHCMVLESKCRVIACICQRIALENNQFEAFHMYGGGGESGVFVADKVRWRGVRLLPLVNSLCNCVNNCVVYAAGISEMLSIPFEMRLKKQKNVYVARLMLLVGFYFR